MNAVYRYSCPDCRGEFDRSQIHQHPDGEWIDGRTLADFYQSRRWLEMAQPETTAFLSFATAEELAIWIGRYVASHARCNVDPPRLEVIRNGISDFANQVRTWKQGRIFETEKL